MSKSFEESFTADSRTRFDDAFWNRFVGEVGLRLRSLESVRVSWDLVVQQGMSVVLDRINEVLLPAGERIRELTELGFLIAYSSSPTTLEAGQSKTFILNAGAQADLFTPSEFLALTRAGSVTDYGVARLVSFDRETLALTVNVVDVFGDPGPHTDWEIAAVGAASMAAVEAMSKAILARDLAEAWAERAANQDVTVPGTRSAKHWATRAGILAGEAQGSAGDAATSAAAAAGSAGAAESARTSFLQVYRGALSADPAGPAAPGDFFLDTALGVVKVYQTSTGWAPAVSAALGGVRRQDYRSGLGNLANGQTSFAIGGGFTSLDVFKNGVQLVEGVDYTAVSPNFTLTVGVAAGDALQARGYSANDVSDFYTKAQADSGFAKKVHGHAIADVAGLTSALAGKSNNGHSHVVADISGLGDLATKNASGLSLQSTGSNNVNYPVTEVVFAELRSHRSRNTAVMLQRDPDSSRGFLEVSPPQDMALVLPGTWFTRGNITGLIYGLRRVI